MSDVSEKLIVCKNWESWLGKNVLAVSAVLYGTWNYECEKTWKCDKYQKDGEM